MIVYKDGKEVAPKFGGAKGKLRSSTVSENSIPADLILNWDQRGVRMVPVNDWTMTTSSYRGSKRVSVTGLGDKRDTFFSNKCPFLNWLYTSTADFVLPPKN